MLQLQYLVLISSDCLCFAMTGSKITNKIAIIQNTHISTYSNAIMKKTQAMKLSR